jgi:hypothetical protein
MPPPKQDCMEADTFVHSTERLLFPWDPSNPLQQLAYR